MIVSTYLDNGFFGGYFDQDKVPSNRNVASISYNNQFIKGKWNGLDWIEGATNEEMQQNLQNKIQEYRLKIYDLTESLIVSSKARALNKISQGLNYKQLQDLEITYTNKKNVAVAYLGGNSNLNPIILDLISFEVENDFAGVKLDNEIAYFNSNYNANIDTLQTRLHQYCQLILVKFNLGVQLYSTLQALCESFRSKMITNLDNLEFDKIDQRIQLVKTITNETTIDEILTTIKDDFDAI